MSSTLSFNSTNSFLETANVVYVQVTLVLENATLETDLTFGVMALDETGIMGVFCSESKTSEAYCTPTIAHWCPTGPLI